jgi:hypothetical protein
MSPTASSNSVVTAADDQISSDLYGEAVILNLKPGTYHGLDPIGAQIWQLIQETPRTMLELRDGILQSVRWNPINASKTF